MPGGTQFALSFLFAEVWMSSIGHGFHADNLPFFSLLKWSVAALKIYSVTIWLKSCPGHFTLIPMLFYPASAFSSSTLSTNNFFNTCFVKKKTIIYYLQWIKSKSVSFTETLCRCDGQVSKVPASGGFWAKINACKTHSGWDRRAETSDWNPEWRSRDPAWTTGFLYGMLFCAGSLVACHMMINQEPRKKDCLIGRLSTNNNFYM